MSLISRLMQYLLLLLSCTLLLSCKKEATDWNINFEYNSTKPLGLKLFYESLEHNFPKADIHYYKSNVSYNKIDQERNFKYEKPLFITVANTFSPDEEEWQGILGNVIDGYIVWISADNFSETVESAILTYSSNKSLPINDSIGDNYEVNMYNVCFDIKDKENKLQQFKGMLPNISRNYFNYDKDLDTLQSMQTVRKITPIEYYCSSKESSYIVVQLGYGKLYLHNNPTLFTNYFLLQKQNFNYLNNVFNTVDDDFDLVAFQSYIYAEKTENSLSNLLKHLPIKIAFWIIIIIALVYLITEIKRKQRVIPIIDSNENNTASFVQTVGQLYFNLGDNKNIAHKMGQFFLEQIRVKYNIDTQKLDDTFVEKLHQKSGKDIALITTFIKRYHTIQHLEKVDNDMLHNYQKIIQQLNT